MRLRERVRNDIKWKVDDNFYLLSFHLMNTVI